MKSIHATYSSASAGPVNGKLRQSVTTLGRKAKAINQRKPRSGFWVPANQTPSRAPVQTPRSGTKKPTTKRLTTPHAAICDQSVDLIFVGILRFSLLTASTPCMQVVDLNGEV